MSNKKTNFKKSARYHFFFNLSMKNQENTQFPTENVIHFYRPTPLSLKNGHHKIIFHGYFGKYCFFFS